MQQTFSEADKNHDGTLSIGEVHQLLHKLNVNLPKQKVRQMFQVRLEHTHIHEPLLTSTLSGPELRLSPVPLMVPRGINTQTAMFEC